MTDFDDYSIEKTAEVESQHNDFRCYQKSPHRFNSIHKSYEVMYILKYKPSEIAFTAQHFFLYT